MFCFSRWCLIWERSIVKGHHMWWPCCAALLWCFLALSSCAPTCSFQRHAPFFATLRMRPLCGLGLIFGWVSTCANVHSAVLPKPNNMCLVFEDLFEFTFGALCLFFFVNLYLKPKLVNFTRSRCGTLRPIYFMFVLFWVKVSGVFVLPPLFPPRTYTLFR